MCSPASAPSAPPSLHIDYRAIVPVEKTLQVTAELTGVVGRKITVRATLFDDDRCSPRPTHCSSSSNRGSREGTAHPLAGADPGGRTTNAVYRMMVGLTGAVVLAGGILAIPYPGPGWAIVFVGLAILASEFAWAHHTLRFAKSRYDGFFRLVRPAVAVGARRRHAADDAGGAGHAVDARRAGHDRRLGGRRPALDTKPDRSRVLTARPDSMVADPAPVEHLLQPRRSRRSPMIAPAQRAPQP